MDSTALEAELRNYQISVESVSVDDAVSVTYLTAFPGKHVNHGEVGRACNAFLDLYEAGRWDPQPVEATALRADDDVQATWRLEPEWVEGLASYRLSEEDFSERVLATVDES